jgi:hypothetical protein
MLSDDERKQKEACREEAKRDLAEARSRVGIQKVRWVELTLQKQVKDLEAEIKRLTNEIEGFD